MNTQVELSVSQFRSAWRLMCTAGSGHVVAETDGIDFVFSGLPIGFFNIALLHGGELSAARLAERAQAAGEWAADKGVPWMLVVTVENLAAGVDAEGVLGEHGFVPAMTLTGMLAERITPVERMPPGLLLTVPDDEAGAAALFEVNALAYGMPGEAGDEPFLNAEFWRQHVPVLGKVGGQACCCASVMMVDGCRYVALVATVPAKQRRGYADAAMRLALQVAAERHGEAPSVLHATEAGRPVYERLGYEAIATHIAFMEARFAAPAPAP